MVDKETMANIQEVAERLKTTMSLLVDGPIKCDLDNIFDQVHYHIGTRQLYLIFSYIPKRDAYAILLKRPELDENNKELYDENGRLKWNNRRKDVKTIEEAEEAAYLLLGAPSTSEVTTAQLFNTL